MIVSVITVVFNCKEFIGHCLDSVHSQTYHKLEHIIMDGGSSDGTLTVIAERADDRVLLFSASDSGYYDALNKGIAHANGTIIGILNADDEFADMYALENIMTCFRNGQYEAVYGNLNYVYRLNTQRILREWKGRAYHIYKFNYGWMPPHPTVYLKRQLFTSYGNYSLDFGSSADYELMIRFMYKNRINTFFLDQLLINMRAGGMSNGSFNKILNASLQDYQVLKSHHFFMCWMIVIMKKLRKLEQFFYL